MKKLVLFAAVVFGLSTMNAQKGSILLGGNIGYSHNETKFGDSKTQLDSYNWNPYLGVQIADNWTIAADVKFAKEDVDHDTSNKNTRIGGFIRYTQPLSETFSVYANVGAGWQELKTTVSGTDAGKADGYYIGFTPALFINFKNNFGLNFNIGGIEYSHLKQNKSDLKSSKFDLTFGNAFNIGISKNFSL
ncbi:porin family protein [Apibacter muscae]|uniref:Porin family protein n=1 Tax=Apibacter muscae TaxID=2509004 RepID=A0A563DCX0_9FLAO|nr:outer membrane beta-barrel protein [Apibacter muscae]TWP24021.1 porin family protein [Apibacter muscae]TWP27781.1 porin family protein [Apibacter muscae]TWP29601.1 porin family protein [Apibacter muscae]